MKEKILLLITLVVHSIGIVFSRIKYLIFIRMFLPFALDRLCVKIFLSFISHKFSFLRRSSFRYPSFSSFSDFHPYAACQNPSLNINEMISRKKKTFSFRPLLLKERFNFVLFQEFFFGKNC
jgi:hypothetical protein